MIWLCSLLARTYGLTTSISTPRPFPSLPSTTTNGFPCDHHLSGKQGVFEVGDCFAAMGEDTVESLVASLPEEDLTLEVWPVGRGGGGEG